MRNYLRAPIRTIFVMLGSVCNLKCKYCMQHAIVEDALENEINPDVIEFIQEISRAQEEPLRILFYGGEPLVYFKNIQTIIEALRGENVRFSMISNGKLLSKKIVKYLNDYEVQVSISWDGENSSETRGFDVACERRELLLALNSLCLSGVLSARNYILEYLDAAEQMDREYFSRHGYHLDVNLDEIMDLGLSDRSLIGIDMGKMRWQMQEICREYERFIVNGEKIGAIKEKYVFMMIHRLQALQERNFQSAIACGNGYDVLNVDLEGKLYRCHNTHDCVGTIYDSYWNYLGRVIYLDTTKENIKECSGCTVYSLCGGGCPLIGKAVRKEYYCKLKKAVFEPVLELTAFLLKRGKVYGNVYGNKVR